MSNDVQLPLTFRAGPGYWIKFAVLFILATWGIFALDVPSENRTVGTAIIFRTAGIIIVLISSLIFIFEGYSNLIEVREDGFCFYRLSSLYLEMQWNDIQKLEFSTSDVFTGRGVFGLLFLLLGYGVIREINFYDRAGENKGFILIDSFGNADLVKFIKLLMHFAPQAQIDPKVLALRG